MISVGDALRTARERAGLSQAVVASALPIGRVVLSYYETDRRPVPLPTAAALARLYGTSLDRLLTGDETAPYPAGELSALLDREGAPGDRARGGIRVLERYVTDLVEIARELGRPLPGKGTSPFPAVTGASRPEAADAARRLRQHFGLGGRALGDPFQVADQEVLVWRLPLGEDLATGPTDPTGAPSGLFHNHPEVGFTIAVNATMTLGRQAFAVAHELAHAYFHPADAVVSMPGSDTTGERFADAFAAELLVPGEELRRLVVDHSDWSGTVDPMSVVHLQRHFGVSYATLRVRLLQEELIDRETFEALAAVSPSRLAHSLGYPVHRADLADVDPHPLDRFPPRLLGLVRAAVETGVLTVGDAAETLDTSAQEIRQLLARPSIQPDERRIQQDLEAAALASGSDPEGAS